MNSQEDSSILLQRSGEASTARYAVYNPCGKAVEELPVIYGFNNGGSPGFMDAVLIAQDGACLGSHLCSAEGYMPGDLGCLPGSRPDRHEDFQKHYPDGYRMDFVSGDPRKHAGLMAAIALNQQRAVEASPERVAE